MTGQLPHADKGHAAPPSEKPVGRYDAGSSDDEASPIQAAAADAVEDRLTDDEFELEVDEKDDDEDSSPPKGTEPTPKATTAPPVATGSLAHANDFDDSEEDEEDESDDYSDEFDEGKSKTSASPHRAPPVVPKLSLAPKATGSMAAAADDDSEDSGSSEEEEQDRNDSRPAVPSLALKPFGGKQPDDEIEDEVQVDFDDSTSDEDESPPPAPNRPAVPGLNLPYTTGEGSQEPGWARRALPPSESDSSGDDEPAPQPENELLARYGRGAQQKRSAGKRQGLFHQAVDKPLVPAEEGAEEHEEALTVGGPSLGIGRLFPKGEGAAATSAQSSEVSSPSKGDAIDSGSPAKQGSTPEPSPTKSATAGSPAKSDSKASSQGSTPTKHQDPVASSSPLSQHSGSSSRQTTPSQSPQKGSSTPNSPSGVSGTVFKAPDANVVFAALEKVSSTSKDSTCAKTKALELHRLLEQCGEASQRLAQLRMRLRAKGLR